MEAILILKAVIIGIVEGITEFFPISSTTHISLASDFLHFKSIPSFESVIQIGAICSFIFLYRKDIFKILTSLNKKKSYTFVGNITAAFIPTVMIGFLAKDSVDSLTQGVNVIPLSLIFGGAVLIIITKMNPRGKYKDISSIPLWIVLLIGSFQSLAMIPAVSRLGATIVVGRFLNLDMKTSILFSFFLAIPTIFGAGAYDLYNNYAALQTNDIYLMSIAGISAFLVGIPVARWAINYMTKHGLEVFGWYRIALAILIVSFL